MYNDNLSFSSDINYRPIINSGNTSYSISTTSIISLGTVDGTDVTVFIETSGYRRLPLLHKETVYVENGVLKVAIRTTDAISGILYWREYGN